MDVLVLVVLLPMMASIMAQGDQAEYVIDIEDFFQDCDNGKPFPAIKLEDFETLQDDEGNSLMNGNLIFADEYNDPIEMKIYSTRQKQGSWVDGEISRDVMNVCPLIMSSSEPWYVITSAMKKQDCPFEAGHTEKFELLPMGDMGFGSIPESFAGNWRLYVESTTQRGAEKVTECFRVAFSIIEK
ncbi:AAEL009978-PA [Aedes aegypti]|nr:AAEL009978-PA [Aedes aegypti]